MLHIKKSSQRGHTKIDWLNSFHSFSFGEFFDPNNIQFGPIRVLNDDTVQPGAGFPTHPHKDMEIISIVRSGVMAHRDNTGGEGIIRPGVIQKMSAGKGILHSEFNASDKRILRLFQIWVMPDKKGIKPSYEEIRYETEESRNKLYLAASGNVEDGVIFVNQDIKMFVADIEAGNEINYEIDEGRNIYIHLMDGSITVNDMKLKEGDAVEVTNENSLRIKGLDNSGLILFDISGANQA